MRLFGSQKPKHPLLPPDPGFRVPEGRHYLDYLKAVHAALDPNWYLEIGTQKGRSLAFAQGNSIAIDPDFMLEDQVVGAKPQLLMFQQTSDDFFASGYLARNGIAVDFAFLDGMHLFEYLLRDFMNTEAAAAPGAAIAMHDCVPSNHIMSKRDWSKEETRQWTGDVWKLIPILQRYRPDLRLQVIDCPPTALVVVSNLDPASQVLAEAYDDIIAEYTDLTLEAFGADRFFDSFQYTSSEDVADHIALWTGQAG